MMRRYLVVAHHTLGGGHLLEHLHSLRDEDPYCRFHVVVPVHRSWLRRSDEESAAFAEEALNEMLDRLAAMRMGATGEVGDDDPVNAVRDVFVREGVDEFAGVVLSTLPQGISRWWSHAVPDRLSDAFPDVALTHLVADEHLVWHRLRLPVAPPPPV